MENDFSALLADLEALQAGTGDLSKALTAEPEKDDDKEGSGDEGGDEKIRAAAEDAGVDVDGDAKPKGEGDDEGEDGGEYFGKAFDVTLPDGTVQRAFDGTAAIEAIHTRMAEMEGNFLKAMGTVAATVKGLQAVIGQQNDMAKSLRADVATIRNAGSGRKAVLSVHEKPGPAVLENRPEGITPAELMAKALVAQAAGKLTARDIARIEAHQGRGLNPPADVLARIA